MIGGRSEQSGQKADRMEPRPQSQRGVAPFFTDQRRVVRFRLRGAVRGLFASGDSESFSGQRGRMWVWVKMKPGIGQQVLALGPICHGSILGCKYQQ